MRNCPRCGIGMEEDYVLFDGGSGYQVQIGKQGRLFPKEVSKLKAAVCPQCGHVELYKEGKE